MCVFLTKWKMWEISPSCLGWRQLVNWLVMLILHVIEWDANRPYLKVLIWQTLLNCKFCELCSSEWSCVINTLAASLADESMLSLRGAFCSPCTAHLSHLLLVPGWHLCDHERGQNQGNVQPGDAVHVPPATHTSFFSRLREERGGQGVNSASRH